MHMLETLTISVVGLIMLTCTMQGIATAYTAQQGLKQKNILLLETQGIGNILQDPYACENSVGTQGVMYANGVVAYKVDGNVASFNWSIQGNTTVLTLIPVNTMLKPVVLNTSCETVHFQGDSDQDQDGNHHDGNGCGQ